MDVAISFWSIRLFLEMQSNTARSSKVTFKVPFWPFGEEELSLYLPIEIVCTYKGVPEIPRMGGEQVIVDRKTERTQILDKKNGGGTCIPFSKWMNLP